MKTSILSILILIISLSSEAGNLSVTASMDLNTTKEFKDNYFYDSSENSRNLSISYEGKNSIYSVSQLTNNNLGGSFTVSAGFKFGIKSHEFIYRANLINEKYETCIINVSSFCINPSVEYRYSKYSIKPSIEMFHNNRVSIKLTYKF